MSKEKKKSKFEKTKSSRAIYVKAGNLVEYQADSRAAAVWRVAQLIYAKKRS